MLSMVVSLQGQPALIRAKRESFHRTIMEKIAGLPGVVSVSEINHLPLASDLWVSGLKIEGRPAAKSGNRIAAVYRVTRARYFQTMGVVMLRGRDFDARDAPDSPGVVIVNEKLARTCWPGENPLGHRVALNDLDENSKWLTVIGVVADVRQRQWTREPDSEIYLPFVQSPFFSDAGGAYSTMAVVVKTGGEPLALAEPIRNAIRNVNGSVVISNLVSFGQIIDNALWRPRFNLKLTALFAMMAVLMASVGLYGIIAYSVVQRTREIGVRLALGAQTRDVLALVFREGMALTGTGLLLGIAGAFGLMHLVGSLLYGVTPTDLWTFLTTPLLLLLVAMIACWLPARRATKVDPVIALRAE
jgi:putative ABC transport system permease protein